MDEKKSSSQNKVIWLISKEPSVGWTSSMLTGPSCVLQRWKITFALNVCLFTRLALLHHVDSGRQFCSGTRAYQSSSDSTLTFFNEDWGSIFVPKDDQFCSLQDQQDSPGAKGTCHQAYCPESEPWRPHGRWKGLTAEFLWPTHMHSKCTQVNVKQCLEQNTTFRRPPIPSRL